MAESLQVRRVVIIVDAVNYHLRKPASLQEILMAIGAGDLAG